MSVASVPEPLKVNFAFGSIIGNTFVSEAAASTIGFVPLVAAAVVDDVVAADAEPADVVDEELEELLLPHPAATAEMAAATIPAMARLRAGVLSNGTSTAAGRQDPGTLLGFCPWVGSVSDGRNAV
jgi:hypothetical protein